MTTLRDALADARKKHSALGHFNVSDLVALRAVVAAARERKVPVIVGVSESEREFVGVRQIAALVASLRDEYAHPIFLNADHTHSLAKAEEAARAGFDSVIFDASALPFDQNVAETRRAVEVLRGINPAIVVEGETGRIGTGSEIHATAPERVLTTPDEARQFVTETKVDVLAPALGTMHGLLPSMVRGEAQKRLDVERVEAIERATGGIYLTLHGGSGTNDDDLRRAIRAGVTIVHVNTELRLAWRRALDRALAANPDEVAPYRVLQGSYEAVRDVVRGRLAVFSAP